VKIAIAKRRGRCRSPEIWSLSSFARPERQAIDLTRSRCTLLFRKEHPSEQGWIIGRTRCAVCGCSAISFAILGLLLSGRPALAEETIKLAYTDPFSGPFASGGDEFLKNFQFIIARKNAAGGALGKKYELVPFDDKLQPAEALIALKSMTDQNIPFVMHCTGSNVGRPP